MSKLSVKKIHQEKTHEPWTRNLQLALRRLVLKQGRVPRVRVERQVIDRVFLTSTTEEILIDLSVVATKTAVQLPVGDSPGVDQANGVGADVIEELHHRSSAGQGDLADGHGAGGEELGGFTFQSVEREESEELVHQTLGLGVQGCGELGRGDGFVEVLDNEVLGVGGRQAPEVNQEAVP
jgi:hypothetical protein